MSKECNVCHQEWSDEDVDNDNICRYCWDTHADDWIGEPDES